MESCVIYTARWLGESPDNAEGAASQRLNWWEIGFKIILLLYKMSSGSHGHDRDTMVCIIMKICFAKGVTRDKWYLRHDNQTLTVSLSTLYVQRLQHIKMLAKKVQIINISVTDTFMWRIQFILIILIMFFFVFLSKYYCRIRLLSNWQLQLAQL